MRYAHNQALLSDLMCHSKISIGWLEDNNMETIKFDAVIIGSG
jgi:hypothetical protein